ncbi:hypothetical protein EDC04DRAFT_2600104 [Pisolithus marmoratus]|nr:hypothetical protein EDC04DRAFT_2600104 [Pisolithus marmoratus]
MTANLSLTLGHLCGITYSALCNHHICIWSISTLHYFCNAWKEALCSLVQQSVSPVHFQVRKYVLGGRSYPPQLQVKITRLAQRDHLGVGDQVLNILATLKGEEEEKYLEQAVGDHKGNCPEENGSIDDSGPSLTCLFLVIECPKTSNNNTTGIENTITQSIVNTVTQGTSNAMQHYNQLSNQQAWLRLMAWNQQGGKKTSQAEGKQRATDKDGEGTTSGPKKRIVEKKMTHAIKEAKRTYVQEFVEHIWGGVFMVDSDSGTGPTIQHCQVNLHPIDPTFLEEFTKGVTNHGLHNTWQEHDMDIGVHRRDIDLSSLQPAKDTLYSNKEVVQVSEKLVREGDYIDGHKDRALIESHWATNAILPVHQDTEQDSLQ